MTPQETLANKREELKRFDEGIKILGAEESITYATEMVLRIIPLMLKRAELKGYIQCLEEQHSMEQANG